MLIMSSQADVQSSTVTSLSQKWDQHTSEFVERQKINPFSGRYKGRSAIDRLNENFFKLHPLCQRLSYDDVTFKPIALPKTASKPTPRNLTSKGESGFLPVYG